MAFPGKWMALALAAVVLVVDDDVRTTDVTSSTPCQCD